MAMTQAKKCSLGCLCNRLSDTDSAKEIQLIPAGIFRARDGRPDDAPHWSLSAKTAALLIDRFNRQGKPLVIDYEHQTLKAAQNGHPAPAAGWVDCLTWREGKGLYGINPRWTDKARAFIAGGEYRYLSPVIRYSESGEIQELLHAALTNVPALGMIEQVALSVAPLSPRQPSLTGEESDVCQSLGLSPEEFLGGRANGSFQTGLSQQTSGLSATEADICRQLGLTSEEFRRARM